MTNLGHQGLLLGMPNWEVTKPFHALAQIAGIARDADFEVQLHDVNVDFYHHVDDSDKKYWTQDYNHVWFSEEFPLKLWNAHEGWFHFYLEDILVNSSFSFIAFSVNMSTRYFSIFSARHIKRLLPDIPIMFGGVDCFPREFNKGFLSSDTDRYCDIICTGEAEIAFKEYLEEFKVTGEWKTTAKGFLYYDGSTLKNTGIAPLPTLKEKLPLPAYDLFDLSKYTQKGALPFFLSRGCVYSCNFCSEGPNFQRYRCRNADEAFQELVAIIPIAKKYAEIPTFTFADSIVNANIKELRRFVELILGSGLKVFWGAQGHIHEKMSHNLLEQMRKSGFVSFFWGIESGSQNVVDLMKKRFSQKVARRVMDDCIDLNIAQHIPILIGYPGEKPEDVADTIDLILSYKDQPKCHVHLPCQVIVRPNSPLYDDYMNHGLADNRGYDWRSSDNKNNLHVRVARRFVARQAHGNHGLTMAGLVDTEEIRDIDLNDSNTSFDLFSLVFEIAKRGGSEIIFYQALNNENDHLEISFDSSYTAWNKIDKNTPDGRDAIYNAILVAIRSLKQKIIERRRRG